MRCVLAPALVLAASAASPAQPTGSDAELFELRQAAAGDPADPTTRAAAFALVDVLRETRGDGDAETMQAMRAAIALFPDDERTASVRVVLGLAAMEDGDGFGAHLALLPLMNPEFIEANPDVTARAVSNAAVVGDPEAVVRWSAGLDLTTVAPDLRPGVLRARVRAGVALRRLDLAAESMEELDRTAPESLRADPATQYAAAEADRMLGRLESAARRYLEFANIHSSSDQRPQALLQYARVLVRLGRADSARQIYLWITEDLPGTRAAHRSRLELLEMAPGTDGPDLAPGYVEAARQSPDGSGAKEALDRMSERLLGSGHALELISVLTALAAEQDGSLVPLAARGVLRTVFDPALALLVSRQDPVAIAAAVSAASSVGVPVPASRRESLAPFHDAIGLLPGTARSLEEALVEARLLARKDRWRDARDLVDQAMRFARPVPDRLRLDAEVFLAEALWREEREPEALTRLQALAGRDDVSCRPALVLEADIHFAAGRQDEACPLYRRAAEVRATPWVERQLQRCPIVREAGERG